MQRMVMGGNAALRTNRFDLTIDWPIRNGSIDTSAYMLTGSGRVRGDHDMIFYNQRADSAGSVRISDIAEDRTRYTLDLVAVPAEIERIVFCATIETPGLTMTAFDGAGIRISSNGEDIIGFYPDLRDAREVAMRMVEIYRRNGTWKIRADGQGFNDGLAALACSFGIDVAEDEAPPPRSDLASAPQALPIPTEVPMKAPVPLAMPQPRVWSKARRSVDSDNVAGRVRRGNLQGRGRKAPSGREGNMQSHLPQSCLPRWWSLGLEAHCSCLPSSSANSGWLA